MSTRFAGSQDLGQRRRRRLAQEAAGSITALGTGRSQKAGSQPRVAPHGASTESGPRLPRETMIPGSWIALSLLAASGLAVWGVVLWLGLSHVSIQAGIQELTALESGPLPRFYSTVTLLLTAQLSWLIYWHRSRSRKDFLGRYRIWAWAGAFWGLLCLLNATQFHLPLIRTFNSHWPINCWRGESLCWFVPLAIGMLTLNRLVGGEVAPSKPSRVAWSASFVLAVLVASLHFGLEFALPVTWRSPVTAAVTMLWHYSLAVCCLLHARYVTHVTNEAVGKRRSLTMQISRGLVVPMRMAGERVLSLRLPRRRKAPTELEAAAPAVKKTAKPKGASKASSRKTAAAGKAIESSAIDSAPKITATSPTTDQQPQPQNLRRNWGSAFKQFVPTGWLVRTDTTSDAPKTADATVAKAPVKAKPERRDKPTAPASTPATLAVKSSAVPTAAKRVAPPGAETALPADFSEKVPLTRMLGGKLLSRWKVRADRPVETQESVPAPHIPPKAPAVPSASPAPQKASVKPVAAAVKPAAPPREAPQFEPEIDDDDGSSDLQGMSKRERKRQKKLQRAQRR